jgi:hypothetical protein
MLQRCVRAYSVFWFDLAGRIQRIFFEEFAGAAREAAGGSEGETHFADGTVVGAHHAAPEMTPGENTH